jgi:hypothetical protein
MISTYQPLCAVQHQTFHEMVLSLSDKAPTVGYEKIRSLLSDKYFESLKKISNIVKENMYLWQLMHGLQSLKRGM